MFKRLGSNSERTRIDLAQPGGLGHPAHRAGADEAHRAENVDAVPAPQQRRAKPRGQQAGRPNPGCRMRADPAAVARPSHTCEPPILQHRRRCADRVAAGDLRVFEQIGGQDMGECTFGKWAGLRRRRRRALAGTPASSSLFRAITSQRKAMSTPVRSWNTSAAATSAPPLPQPRSSSASSSPAERERALNAGSGAESARQCDIPGENRREPVRNVVRDRIVKSDERAKIVLCSEFVQPRRLRALVLERQIEVAAQAEVGNPEQDRVDAGA